MASDPLSYYGIWYWPEDKNGEACYTAVCNVNHYDCTKGWLRYPNGHHPSTWIDTEVDLQISPKTLIEWSEE